MNNYKVAVYAISKNEEKFVKRWYNSVKEADEIYVLDTGSTDNTVELLKELGVTVKQEVINPWRFDVARNKSLDMVPNDVDICVCIDLDEVLDPGWKDVLVNTWDDLTNRVKYIYNWSLDENNKPLVTFLYDKIHSRKNYKWIYPVHEVLSFSKENENVKINKEIVLNHYPDNTKSRSSYLPLLELSVLENPLNDRNMHYLGREYMYHHEWNKSIDTLIKHLNLKSSTWKEERSASMRFIARCYQNLNRIEEATMWYKKAIEESPNMKEPYIELAILESNRGNYFNSIINCLKSKNIKENQLIYITESFSNDSTVDDLLSINYYNLGFKEEALFYIDKALEKNPNDERLLKNKEIFLK